MVSFVSITRGISFFMLVSSMLTGSAHAAPASNDATIADVSSTFTLPPIIKDRVAFSNDIADTDYFNLTKRESETIGGNQKRHHCKFRTHIFRIIQLRLEIGSGLYFD